MWVVHEIVRQTRIVHMNRFNCLALLSSATKERIPSSSGSRLGWCFPDQSGQTCANAAFADCCDDLGEIQLAGDATDYCHKSGLKGEKNEISRLPTPKEQPLFLQ